MNRQYRQRGFTLIEIVVVVMLAGMLVLTFGSSLFTVPSGAAERDAVRMAARLAHARTQGILRGGSCLKLTASAVTYGSEDAAMSPLPGEGGSASFESTLGLDSTLLPPSLCFDATGQVCTALPAVDSGDARRLCTSASASGNITLSFTDADTTQSLILYGATGLAERVAEEGS